MVQIDDLDLQFQEKADPKLLEKITKLGDALVMIYKVVAKPIVLPRIFQVKGEVEVTRQAPVQVSNLNEMKKYFESLERTFNNMILAVQSMPQPQIKLPKFEIPTQIKADNPELQDLLEKINEKLDNIQPTEIKFPTKFDIGNFPPQMIPQPVTNININPLQGFVKTTDNTVGTVAVSLPNYGQLFNRRSIIVYNNSANTIYIGGSDVTVSNGMPIPANSYSPAIDAGYNLIVYGVASQGGNDIRVIEISKDKTANVQE